MFNRSLKLPKSQSFLLLGPRGTGKSTLLRNTFVDLDSTVWFDLLDLDVEARFLENPSTFKHMLEQLPPEVNWVVVDEIQKVPALLNTIHQFIEKKRFKFALTGSSARKLKRGQANLLAGRAFVRTLWPLLSSELGDSFSLEHTLSWGSLPRLFELDSSGDKADFLRTYVHTYLSEEVIAEQLVRNVTPFRRFLSVAGQMNGKIINASKIGKDVGADYQTVLSYFEILEDTLVGFTLPAYESSVRRRVRQRPKFYLFDVGVARAMSRMLEVPLKPETSYYGELFEHFIVSEIFRLVKYSKPDWELFYLQTKDGAEVDVIIDRPGAVPIFIEIKSTTKISTADLASYLRLVHDFGKCESYIVSNDRLAQNFGGTRSIFWKDALDKIFFEG